MEHENTDDRRRRPPEQERPTLGRLLDAQARRRALALQPHVAWAQSLATVIRRAERLGDVVGQRFDRFEARLSTDPASSASAVAALVRPGGTATRDVAESGDGGDGTRSRDADPELRDLPPSARYRLRRDVGAGADEMRVHAGPHADSLARAAGADAVTIGRDVHLRQGRYAPHREDGLALLMHEATHVAAVLDPGHAWRRVVGDDDEERLARAREAEVLGGARGRRDAASAAPLVPPPPGPAGSPGPRAPRTGVGGSAQATAPSWSAPVAPVAPTAPAGRRRAADIDRDLTGNPPAAPDLEALRRGIVADVMRQIKTEFERGG